MAQFRSSMWYVVYMIILVLAMALASGAEATWPTG